MNPLIPSAIFSNYDKECPKTPLQYEKKVLLFKSNRFTNARFMGEQNLPGVLARLLRIPGTGQCASALIALCACHKH
ncbi:MAG: hypothetical protein HKM93_12040 [Desulfobacteraceae bacterium]|nr:hypothetical protein [Desulfobacteraceae bacterium]